MNHMWMILAANAASDPKATDNVFTKLGHVGQSFWDAIQQPITIVVVIVLLWVLIRDIGTIRRMLIYAADLREAVRRGSLERQSLSDIQSMAPESLRPLISDLVSRWGVDQAHPPTHRFSPASDVISSDRFFATELRWRLVEITPGLATGVGILGTFLGISLGLGTISFGTNADADAVFSSVGGVVDGLASAFWTSIFGVCISIYVNWRTRRTESTVEDSLHEVCELLDRMVPQLTPLDNHAALARTLAPLQHLLETQVSSAEIRHKWLRRVAKVTRQNREIQHRTFDELKGGHDTLRSLADDLVTKMEQGFGKAVGPHLEKMTAAVETVANAGIQSAKVFVQEMMTDMQSGLSDTIAKVGQSMNAFHERFEALTDRLEKSARNQLDVLERGEAVAERVRGRLSELDGMMERVQGFHEAMLALEKQQALTQERVGSMANSLVGHVDNLQTSMAVQLEGARASIESIASGLAHTQNIVRDFGQDFDDFAKRFDALGGDLRSTASALKDRIEAEVALVERYSEGANKMTTAMHAAESFMKNAPTLAGALAEVAKQQHGVAKALHGAPERVGALVETLEKRFSGVDHAAAQMEKAVEATSDWAETANKAIRDFQSGVQTVLGQSLSQFDGELQRAIRALGEAMGELEDLIETAAKQKTDTKSASQRSSTPENSGQPPSTAAPLLPTPASQAGGPRPNQAGPNGGQKKDREP